MVLVLIQRWEEARVSGENPDQHRENTETPSRKKPTPAFSLCELSAISTKRSFELGGLLQMSTSSSSEALLREAGAMEDHFKTPKQKSAGTGSQSSHDSQVIYDAASGGNWAPGVIIVLIFPFKWV